MNKTNDIINIELNNVINSKNPMVNNDSYECCKSFDGKIIINNRNFFIYYYNLKFVCGLGGAQTRTLREVYHFIKYQIEFLIENELKNYKISKIYFINILDGDTCYNNMKKFYYLLNKDKYKDKNISDYIFIGSLHNYQKIKLSKNFINYL